MSDVIQIPNDVLQKTFDTAVHSLDFGSGFLDNEEVEALRAVARLLNVNEAVATPDAFRAQYGLVTKDQERSRECNERYAFLLLRNEHWIYHCSFGTVEEAQRNVQNIISYPSKATEFRIVFDSGQGAVKTDDDFVEIL